MSDQLFLSLFGPPTITQDGQAVTGLRTRKVKALLFYLAATQQPHSREQLAELFFDDREAGQSAANLRALLSRLRRQLGDYVLTTRETVIFNKEAPYWLDTAEFEQGLTILDQQERLTTEAATQLKSTLKLYQGEFLAGFHLREARGFEAWRRQEQERLRQLAVNGLKMIVSHHLHQRNYTEGIQQAQILIQLAPLQESNHRLLMRLLARNEQHNAALSQYKRCHQLLDDELGIEPDIATQALYERIRMAKATPATHKLPSQFTPFIGRQTELAQISERLDDDHCRLLTLVGPGGAGKTRLAVQAADGRRGEYLHGIYFISFAATESAVSLAPHVANVLNIPLHAQASPHQQLLDYLHDKEMLLLFDNLEHLVNEGANLTQAILESGSQIQLIVTSRERLHLRAEWLLPVKGLPYNGVDNKSGFTDSVQLFQTCAHRVQPRFKLMANTETAVQQICQLVEGSPLGIELAAASLFQHTTTQIATEIQRNHDFLTTQMRDIPDRHRSVRAVFKHSWALLSASEKRVFQQLAVFRGSFNLKAADHIANASQEMLTTLVTKSLLRPLAKQRYALHELLRQYAHEKLIASTETAVGIQQTRVRHANYYAHFLQSRESQFDTEQEEHVIQEIIPEIDNIKAAWHWAVAQSQYNILDQFIGSLHSFYVTRGWFQEEAQLFAQAVDKLQQDEETKNALVTGRLLVRQGYCFERLAKFDEASTLIQQSLVIFEQHNAVKEMIFALNHRGILAFDQGNYLQAKQFFEQGLMLNQEIENQNGIGYCLLYLGTIAMEIGHYKEAETLCQRSLEIRQAIGSRREVAINLNALARLARITGDYAKAIQLFEDNVAICREINNPVGIGVSLYNLGDIARMLGQYDKAKAYYQQGLLNFQKLGDPWGTAVCATRLGNIAEATGNYTKAQTLYETALTLCQQIGDQRGLGIVLCGLGNVAYQLDDRQTATTHLQQALEVSLQIEALPTVLKSLLGLAHLRKEQDVATALKIATFTQHHPATDKEIKEMADSLKVECVAVLPAKIVERIQRNGRILATDKNGLATLLNILKSNW